MNLSLTLWQRRPQLETTPCSITSLNLVTFTFFDFFQLLFGCPTAIFGQLSMDQPHSPDVNHCVLRIPPQSHREPCNEVGSLSPAKCLVRFEWGTFQFWLQRLNPLDHSPFLVKLKFSWYRTFVSDYVKCVYFLWCWLICRLVIETVFSDLSILFFQSTINYLLDINKWKQSNLCGFCLFFFPRVMYVD